MNIAPNYVAHTHAVSHHIQVMRPQTYYDSLCHTRILLITPKRAYPYTQPKQKHTKQLIISIM